MNKYQSKQREKTGPAKSKRKSRLTLAICVMLLAFSAGVFWLGTALTDSNAYTPPHDRVHCEQIMTDSDTAGVGSGYTIFGYSYHSFHSVVGAGSSAGVEFRPEWSPDAGTTWIPGTTVDYAAGLAKVTDQYEFIAEQVRANVTTCGGCTVDVWWCGRMEGD